MKREHFELIRLKVDKEGRVDANWRRKITDGDAVYADKCAVESPRICSPDLQEILEELRHILAHTNQLYVHKKIETFEPKLRELIETKDGQRIMKKLDDSVLESMKISGISLGGDLETGWCVVTGTHAVWNTAVAMNSPKINLDSDTFMIENELKKVLTAITDEVYAYVFEGKGAQQTLFKKEETEEGGENREDLQEA